MSRILASMKERAAIKNKRLVFPEGEEERIIRAAEIITSEKIASVTLLGDEYIIRNKCKDVSLDNIKIINPKTAKNAGEYAKALYEIRKSKGMDMAEATKLAQNNLYYGSLMIKMGEIDGMVAGSITATSDVLRPALQVVRTGKGISTVSSFFVMVMPDDSVYIYSDCGVVIDPDYRQLADIAIASAQSMKTIIGNDPRVAMLSFSTKGSATHESIDKVVKATRLAKEMNPQLIIDGELQVDAALVPKVASLKAPDSPLKGVSNVLIFPDLNSGNIAYKLTQRLANAIALGPICQGFASPVNDLSRGCSVEDIVSVAAITVLQTR